MWNYWVGGKDHFAADRAAAERIAEALPALPAAGQVGPGVPQGRAVHNLAAEHGVRQFLDIGTGLPTADNTHEVAQRAVPESRIVYTDYDPSVLAHARALLTSTPEGRTAYIRPTCATPTRIAEGGGRDAGLQPAGRDPAVRRAPLHPGRGRPVPDHAGS